MNGHSHEQQMERRGGLRTEESKHRNRRQQINHSQSNQQAEIRPVQSNNRQRPGNRPAGRGRVPRNEIEALMQEYQDIENDQMNRINDRLENQIRQIAADQHRRHGQQRVRRVGVIQEHPQRRQYQSGDGLSLNQISEYPTAVLERAIEQPCCICMEIMDAGQTVKTLPCLHRFHEKCIDNWISRVSTCPIDKQPLA